VPIQNKEFMKKTLFKRTDYSSFFNLYRNNPVKSDEELIYQVGWSIQNEPLEKNIILDIVDKISIKLQLKETDTVLDLCCGNGVLTFELSKRVNSVVGIDFTKGYIENANEFKKNNNISYYLGSVNDFKVLVPSSQIEELKAGESKILMSYSLGYFDEESLASLLSNLDESFEHFKFYITGIPNYEDYKIVFPGFVDQIIFLVSDRIFLKTKGIGRFWKKSELTRIAGKFGFRCDFDNDFKKMPGQSYRFNTLITKL
jgi:SAM-dependent methyltransferase